MMLPTYKATEVHLVETDGFLESGAFGRSLLNGRRHLWRRDRDLNPGSVFQQTTH